MRSWLKEAAVFCPASIIGLAAFWAPDRVGWVWVVPLGLLVGAIIATLRELANRPREFLRDVRRLARNLAKPS